MSFQLRRRWIAGLLFCLTVVFLTGCPAGVDQEQKKEPAEGAVAEQPGGKEPAEKAKGQQPPEKPDQPAPPEGPEPEPPDPYVVPDGTPAELAQYIEGLLGKRPPDAEARQRSIDAMLEAADKILAGEPDEAAALTAVRVKTMLVGPEELEALAEQLNNANLPKLARQVRGAVLGHQLRLAVMVDTPENAAEKIEKLIGEIKDLLAEAPLEPDDVGLVMHAARMAERTGNTELAADAYTAFAKLLATSDDEEIAKLAKMFEGVVRRLTLVGKEMKVEGTLLDGQALDWSKYNGKVVLVDFWATWCPPCVREIPRMKKEYELYQDRGFEILGLSCDETREPLEAFLEKNDVPWTIVYGENGPSPTVEYYGIMSYPTMILVGSDGKVVSTSARGPQLRAELEKLLGPAEEKDKQEDGKQEDREKDKEKDKVETSGREE